MHPSRPNGRYRRDKRLDCVQVVIALIVTPDGFPLAYEVMPGNTADETTLMAFLRKIEDQHGRSDRIWIMDRGIPTEKTLASMREGDAPARYLGGTPKGRLTRLEKAFLDLPWQEVRQSVNVKMLVEEGELYVLVHSEGRQLKERGMRRRRLPELQGQSNSRDQLMLKLGAAKKEAGRAWSLVVGFGHFGLWRQPPGRVEGQIIPVSGHDRLPDECRGAADHRRPAPRPAAPHPSEQGARNSVAPTRHDPAATDRTTDQRLTALEPPLPFGAL